MRQTDNQQAKILVQEKDISWLAGFIDGEGCISFIHRNEKNTNNWRTHVQITNTHVPTLNTCTDILERMGVGHHVWWFENKNKRYSKRWDIRISGFKRVHKLLRIITPYLHTKQERAEIMLDFINLRLPKNPIDKYGDEEMRLISTMCRLNKKGPRD